MNTTWTQEPPNKPGWYWVRRQSVNECSVEYYPHHGVYPIHWVNQRQDSINFLREYDSPEILKAFESLDLKGFIVEYNGPIPVPE